MVRRRGEGPRGRSAAGRAGSDQATFRRSRAMAAALVMALAVGALPAAGLTPQGRRCDELWRQASAGTRARDPQSLAQLPEKWKAQAAACGSTSVYQARLAMAYALAGDLEGASQTVQAARGAAGDAYLIEYARLVVDYVRILFPERAPP